MMRFCLSIAILLACIPLGAAGPDKKPLFCTDPGTHLYYERYKANSQQLLQTTDIDVDSVEETAKGLLVHTSVVLRQKGKRVMLGGKASITTAIDAAGNTSSDLASSVKGFVLEVFPKAKIKSSGTLAVMPRLLHPGDTLPEAHCRLELPLLVITVDVTGREVLRKEQITTPAGTFDCVVVRSRKVEDIPLHYKDNWQDDWYAPGIGYVRHMIYDKNMNPAAVEELVRIDRE